MNTILLLFLAIALAAVLMVLIYWMDRHEPESLKNILMAMLIGALSIIPAIIIEVGFGSMPIFLLPGLARFGDQWRSKRLIAIYKSLHRGGGIRGRTLQGLDKLNSKGAETPSGVSALFP